MNEQGHAALPTAQPLTGIGQGSVAGRLGRASPLGRIGVKQADALGRGQTKPDIYR
jgi:hypothetical protein